MQTFRHNDPIIKIPFEFFSSANFTFRTPSWSGPNSKVGLSIIFRYFCLNLWLMQTLASYSMVLVLEHSVGPWAPSVCVSVWLGLLSNCFALFLQVGASPSLPALKPSPPTYTVNQFLKLSEEPVAGISETANQKKDDIEGQFVCGLIGVHVANVFRWPSAWYYVWT